MKQKITGLLLLFMVSCQPSSLEDFAHEGAAHTRLLIEDLQKIQAKEDLVQAEPILKKHFEKLVDYMILARNYKQKHPDEEVVYSVLTVSCSQELLEEMQRVYAIEGGKECVERAQKEAMLRLDAKEQAIRSSSTRTLK
ncbi:MAG: hypothetical protein FJZ58_06700 [Chlamydiae bacterium]|nr:hypothetical protein [Chlamydiota bacterium]